MSSEHAIDLVASPFDVHRASIASPSRYDETQAIGDAMRAAGVELFRYPSARAANGVNVGVFSPAAFGRAKPRGFETWHCVGTHARVELSKRDYFARGSITFAREQFLVDGRLPTPAL